MSKLVMLTNVVGWESERESASDALLRHLATCYRGEKIQVNRDEKCPGRERERDGGGIGRWRKYSQFEY